MTTPETIDLPKARELLARAVETQGRDFVYKPEGFTGPCNYFPMTDLYGQEISKDPRSKTGCLVGVALSLHGIDVWKLAGSVDLLAEEYPNMMTGEAQEYFQLAQEHQDNGSTWGEAYDRAEVRGGNLA